MSIDDDSEQPGDQPSMTRVLFILLRNDETYLCTARTAKTGMCGLLCSWKYVFSGGIGHVIAKFFFFPFNKVDFIITLVHCSLQCPRMS